MSGKSREAQSGWSQVFLSCLISWHSSVCVSVVFIRGFGERTFQIQDFELNCNATGPEFPMWLSAWENKDFPSELSRPREICNTTASKFYHMLGTEQLPVWSSTAIPGHIISCSHWPPAGSSTLPGHGCSHKSIGKIQLDLVQFSKELKVLNCSFAHCILSVCCCWAALWVAPGAPKSRTWAGAHRYLPSLHLLQRFVLSRVWNALGAGRLWLDSQYYGDLSHKLLEGREWVR